jgi:hypothetical protein
MAICKSCGKQIRWIKTQAGKNMPCDYEEVTYRIPKSGKGRANIVTPNGEVISADIVPNGTQDAAGIGYISHFATCPNADQHRRSKL